MKQKNLKAIMIYIMKKVLKCKFLIVIFFLSFSKLYANEKDSLRIYLMESDSVLFVDLVIENVSNDTIFIPTIFRNYLFYDWGLANGIGIITHFNNEQFGLRNYAIQDRFFRFSDNGFYLIPPKEKIIYEIELKHYFDFKISINDEIGVRLALNFYYVVFTRNPNTIPVLMNVSSTNYVRVKGEYKIEN